jgi:hypothetical protein
MAVGEVSVMVIDGTETAGTPRVICLFGTASVVEGSGESRDGAAEGRGTSSVGDDGEVLVHFFFSSVSS